MSGILYICGTPIGNLEDISLRALNTLREVDLIAAEDTRHSAKLLNFYEIKTRLTSYHEHNKYSKGEKLIALLQEGQNIALITDAGMPAISDPGEELVKLCHQRGIKVTAVPGPTAVITALVLSGQNTRRYVFEGFLPKEKKEKKAVLAGLQKETRTIIFYESPHQLRETLELFLSVFGDRMISVIRELTKKHEEVYVNRLSYACAYFNEKEVKGEFVLVLEGEDPESIKAEEIKKWADTTLEQHFEQYVAQGMDRKEAMKQVAKDRGMNKRDVYQQLLPKEEE